MYTPFSLSERNPSVFLQFIWRGENTPITPASASSQAPARFGNFDMIQPSIPCIGVLWYISDVFFFFVFTEPEY